MNNRFVKSACVSIGLCSNSLLSAIAIAMPLSAQTLPPDNDIPEEVLRAEIVTEARSPIDGKALSATEFAELVVTTQQQLEDADARTAASDPKYKEVIFLLRLRGFLKSIGIPIK